MPASDAGSAKGGKVRFLQLFQPAAGPRFRCTIMRLPTRNCTDRNPCTRAVIIILLWGTALWPRRHLGAAALCSVHRICECSLCSLVLAVFLEKSNSRRTHRVESSFEPRSSPQASLLEMMLTHLRLSSQRRQNQRAIFLPK